MSDNVMSMIKKADLGIVKEYLPDFNEKLRDLTPDEVIDWALTLTDKRIVTTSFGIYSAVLLSTFHRKDPDIRVVWCDTRYNNVATYAHSVELITDYSLNVKKYEPLQPLSFTDTIYNKIEEVDDKHHQLFAKVVKIEPFARALRETAPDLWFTNIRVRQTEYRNSKDILSVSKHGILKVSPFYYWSDADLDAYISKHGLLKNTNYVDPVKALSNRECGIHLQ